MTKLHGHCWAITDESAGNQRQALALAERLELPVHHLILEPRAPWSWLAPRMLPGMHWALDPAQRALFASPWPAVAIGCGRASALFTRRLRLLSSQRCYTVQILDPRIDPRHWDLVIAPRHDRLHGENVLNPLGSLHPVDDHWLAEGREAFAGLADLPEPRIGVLLGGPRKGVPIDADYARRLLDGLLAIRQRDGGSLLVLGSRRTPAAVTEVFRDALKNLPGLCWAGPRDGTNPYAGVLGWAQRLVVTPDSVNMLSEACAVGCPVHTLVTAPLPAKLAAFHRALGEGGYLSGLDDAPRAAHPPTLRETAAIATILKTRVAARQA